jgi:DNA-directed RNA polymerase specialized sigma24 family protein
MHLDDADLARRLPAGDPLVFRMLSTELWPALAWRMRRRGGRLSVADLEDLRQEWLLRAWRERHSYDPALGALEAMACGSNVRRGTNTMISRTFHRHALETTTPRTAQHNRRTAASTIPAHTTQQPGHVRQGLQMAGGRLLNL